MSKKINERAETVEEHSRLAEPHNAVRVKKSVNVDPDSRIGLDINLERAFDAVWQKQHLEQRSYYKYATLKKRYTKKMLP